MQTSNVLHTYGIEMIMLTMIIVTLGEITNIKLRKFQISIKCVRGWIKSFSMSATLTHLLIKIT